MSRMRGNTGSGGIGERIRELLHRKGAVPIAGGLAALAAIGVLFIALASGGGDEGTKTPDSGANVGLKTETPLASPEATLDLNQPTPVGTRNPNAPVPGASNGDRLIIGKFAVDA